MKKREYYVAVDIGASSGRHIVGWLQDGEMQTEEVYRFYNGVTEQEGHLVWDIERLWQSVKNGLKAAFEKFGALKSVAVDTWGVDYVLLDGDKVIAPCYAYRDSRTLAMIDMVHAKIPYEELYQKTGIEFQPFNSIYQFYDDLQKGRLQRATDFLMIPEYLTYRLCGVKYHEYTNATTTGLVNPTTLDYDGEILTRLGLPAPLFTTPVQAGTVLGELLPEVASEVGGNLKVVACAGHDTASAVEGIPMQGNEPYISSGTWSLLGVKVPKVITKTAGERSYSNEGGVGYVRYQTNIMGMWIVNNLKKELCPDMDFGNIIAQARTSKFTAYVDVDEGKFLAPKSMKASVDSCFAQGEGPQNIGDYFNCAFISLARSYQRALTEISANTGRKFERLYIVGGGAKNGYLNELTASVCGIEVIALPIEATALGNLLVQSKA